MVDPKATNSASRPASLFRRLAQRLRGDTGAQQILESLEEVIEESERENPALTPRERTMLANLLKFGELRVGELMVPRADIVAVEESTSLHDLLARFREAQHSRLPIYRETLDDPIGLVHIKDVVGQIVVSADGTMRLPNIPITTLKRELLVAPPSMPARDLLLRMQTTHLHLALVIDEYGGTDGLITIEDLVEQIVGDIDDEHDVDESPEWRALPDGSYEADGLVPLEDFTEQTGISLQSPNAESEVDTLGGLVTALMGRLPQRGEIIADVSGNEFEILEADPRRIRRLRLKPAAKLADQPA
jgi:CBS domain containing-hemolysin-like protein